MNTIAIAEFTSFEWIAIAGALAWFPHALIAVRYFISRPEITIITERAPEIGFTSLGPILNLRIAFSVKYKATVVSDIRIRIRHESGDERVFGWQGITHRMLQMGNPGGNPIPFEKELSVLAIKISEKDIEERHIRFQELKFIHDKEQLIPAAVKEINHTKNLNNPPCEPKDTAAVRDLITFAQQSLIWKAGTYRATFELKTPEKCAILGSSKSFTLSPEEIRNLENNKDLIDQNISAVANSTSDPEKLNWQWVYPKFDSPSVSLNLNV
ncbi:hypothetical protein [Synoicihabitans lomoniglobus]|uniref:Uncharacterized protein n=1 Tax=Synoicihabitans lomoniglobus TaxID=2909285 RepID=A0AAF0CPW2_9BACT|nr:hypothetical protein [Opitutaceae bacterium LMO-M01]WED65868.1 hypothetical protein PXH66_03275 [Opitutaceae bacterium LMO-M01]